MKPVILSYLFFLFLNLIATFGKPARSGDVNDNSAQWREKHFAKGIIPPFAFEYGGKKSDDFITKWNFSAEKLKSNEPNSDQMVFHYEEPSGGLRVSCFVSTFSDFRAIEWMLKFSNKSAQNSPVIEKVAAVRHTFTSQENGNTVLHHAKGSNAERSDFQPIDEILQSGKDVYLSPVGGRSSDNTAFPFFNLEMPGNQGVMVAIGWSGKWYANLLQVDGQSVCLNSGMEKMQLSLYPNEEIRTPKICLLFWKGEDRMIGHNQFRQFILAHHSRKINGRFAEYPLSGSFDYGDPAPCGEYNCLTSEFAIALVKRYQQFRILPELFWLDAGWYTGCGWDKEKGEWWQNVGNWTVDKERFPNGLKPVADAVHEVGAKLMVWFEPERVRPGTQIDREHPEWLTKLKGRDDYLFDLGNKEARLWMTNYLSDLIRKEGIDYYRQDFNFDPMPYWDASNHPGRTGIAEIRHIEGLYAFWDSLLVRFPKLLIDNCASGGRRIDLETTSRSAPLWRTDYQYGEPNGYQCHTFGLNFYLPIHGTAIYKTDSYTFRSGLGATAAMSWEVTGRESESIPSIQKRIKDFLNLRPFFYGDYYPLTGSKNTTRDNIFLAYQLNRPDKRDGIILVFRRTECSEETISIKMRGLDPLANYELAFEDYGIHMQKSGHELMEGMELSIPQKNTSLLVKYSNLK